MSYLLTQMSLYMLATFLLGLLLGWLIWRNSGVSQTEFDTLRAERDSLTKERDDLMTNLDACRKRSAQERETTDQLRADKIDLQTKLDALTNERNAALTTPMQPVDDTPIGSSVGTRPQGLDGPRGGVADDLKEISGVGPKMEKLVNSLGFYHFDQIAAWTTDEVAWVDDNLEGFKGRVTRDAWIEQAKKLANR